MKDEPIISPLQARTARALLAWSQKDLAQKAHLGQSTVADFERESRAPASNSAEAMKAALEEAGIRFLPGGVVLGTSPGSSQKPKNGAPFRWVDATDLKHWADRRDAQAALPELINRLTLSETSQPLNSRFPSGDSVQLPGPDGLYHIEQEIQCPYIPAGKSIWEFGTSKDVKRKADGDYKNRLPKADAEATFIFVTPRSCASKDQWVKKKNAESKWKEVRMYDADDLVQWIERNPSVADWLVSIGVGKRPRQGTRQLEEAWQEWSFATEPPLSVDLILAGSKRDEQAIKILKWLRGEPAAHLVQAESSEEAIAFLYASIQLLPEDVRKAYSARCLISINEEATRAFISSLIPLIIVLVDVDSGLIQRLVECGHHVYVAYGPSVGAPANSNHIKRLSRPLCHELEKELIKMKIAEKQAERLTRGSGRSLTILRHLMPPSLVLRKPEWSDSKFTRSLIAAMLTGSWDEKNEQDKTILVSLADKPYGKFVEDLTPFLGRLDSPLRRIGNIWKVSSPLDIWFLLASCITDLEFKHFREAVLTVFRSIDPRFDLESTDRWCSGIKGIRPSYSETLRRGLAESLIFFSLYGDQALAINRVEDLVGKIIQSIFEGANEAIWWSLSKDFPLLAEASPESFLRILEENLRRVDSPASILFRDDGVYGREYLSGLLWTLESLAWESKHLTRVTQCLAILAARDPGGSFANRPKNTLKKIFLLWLPQTQAPFATRIKTLDIIRDKQSDVAWRLMLNILPTGYDTTTHSQKFQWRQLPENQPEPATYSLISQGTQEISRRLVEDVGDNPTRWKDLLESFHYLPQEWRTKAIESLFQLVPRIQGNETGLNIRESLRVAIHNHREFAEADWSLPDEEVDKMEKVYVLLEPQDLFLKFEWLFGPEYRHLLQPSGGNWSDDEEEVARLRIQAIREIREQGGIEAVLDFSNKVKIPSLVGQVLNLIPLKAKELEIALKIALVGNSSADESIGCSLVASSFKKLGSSWLDALLKRALDEKWGTQALVQILRALPISSWVWRLAEKLGPEIEDNYWKNIDSLRIEGDTKDIIFFIKKMLWANKPYQAISIASEHLKSEDLPPQLLIEVLKKAAHVPEKSEDKNIPTMFAYNIERIFRSLYQVIDVPEDELTELEWIYLPLLKKNLRQALRLHKKLENHPHFFVEIISSIFKPEENSGVKDVFPEDSDLVRRIAERSYDLLSTWHSLPGTREDGTLDPKNLEKWVETARTLCAQAGRGSIGNQKIGEVLAHSPKDADGIWPIPAVRDIIENSSSDHLETGIRVGTINSRGVTTRNMFEGGEQELKLVEKYRHFATATEIDWPRTSALLRRIAQNYEAEAQRHDEEVEKKQW